MPKQSSFQDRPTVLVTGGAGFLGANLCGYLVNSMNVICVDNYSSGHESDIDTLLSHPHFEFVKHDITEPLDFKHFPGVERFRTAFVGIQYVVHTVASLSPAAYLRHPIDFMMINVSGTKRMLDLAQANRARFLFLSDALVYGTLAGIEHPTEEHLGSLEAYPSALRRFAESLRYAETLIDAYRELYNLETSIVRLHQIYGPAMHFDDGRFVSSLIRKALSHQDIVLSPRLARSAYLYAGDAVDAIEKILLAEKTGVYNLGGGAGYDPSELAEKIVHTTESRSSVSVGEGPIDDQSFMPFWEAECRIPSLTRLKEEIGWFPVMMLDDGLSKTIDFLKSLRGVRSLET